MKASELVEDAYRFGNIVAEEGQDLSAVQVSDGVRLLNYIINKINIDGDEVALNVNETITIPSGSDTLILTDYIKVTKAQYNLGNVFQDVSFYCYEDFYDQATIKSVSSIPYIGYQRRIPEGVEIKFYFTPDKNYELRIVGGLKKISTLSIDDELDANSNFYFELLTWMLASHLRLRNQLPREVQISIEIEDLKERLRRIKPRASNVNLRRIGDSCSAVVNAMETAAKANIMGGWRP